MTVAVVTWSLFCKSGLCANFQTCSALPSDVYPFYQCLPRGGHVLDNLGLVRIITIRANKDPTKNTAKYP